MAGRFAWGIDVGNRALKAVKLVREGDGYRIDDFEFIEHETFLSHSGDNRDSIIQTALTQFVQKHPQKGGVAAISVSGQQSFARFIKLPPVEPKKIPEIVKFEAIQQIPFPLEDVEWSYQLFHSPESPEVEVGIFAMRKELIQSHVNAYTGLDINVQVVQMSPLAVFNAIAHDGKIDGTTMIIDIGAENTDLIISDGQTVWLRSIPIGGNSFTEALSKSFKVTFQKAEDMKRTAGTSKYVRQIMQAMRPVFGDLVSEIQRSQGFYMSTHRDSKINKIVAVGGTFKLPGLQKYLQQNLQLDVERLDTVVAQPPGDAKLAANLNDHLLSSFGAYGLALQAMGETKITSSLLPSAIRREMLWRDKTKWFAGAAALFVIGTGVAYGSWYMSKTAYDAQADTRSKIASVQSTGNDLDSKWQQISGSGGQDLAKVNNVRSLLNFREFWPNLLESIQASLPQPQEAIVKGDIEGIKKIPRGQRNLIQIDQMTSNYVPDLTPMLTDDATFKRAVLGTSGGGLPAGIQVDPGAAATDPGQAVTDPNQVGANAKSGFLITLKGTTPFTTGYSMIQQELVDKLKKIASKDHKFYVANAVLAYSDKVAKNGTRLAQLQKEYADLQNARNSAQFQGGAAVNFGGGGPGADGVDGNAGGPGAFVPAPTAVQPGQPGSDPNANPAFQDRLTGESVLDDFEYTVVFAVVLGDPPAPAAAPAAPAK